MTFLTSESTTFPNAWPMTTAMASWTMLPLNANAAKSFQKLAAFEVPS